ncbi:hypothetical protein HDV00_010636 [Rhizophlyctis rosea]|nr:hypothetical protein HDV00_010636 [Rhizophlyctis rosea]
MDNLFSGEPLPPLPLHPKDRVKLVRGSRIIVHHKKMCEDGVKRTYAKIISLDDPASAFEILPIDLDILPAFNENLLAYIPHEDDRTPRDLILMRLQDQQRIASYHFTVETGFITSVELTRFNVFVSLVDWKVWVFDFKLSFLYAIPNYGSVRYNGIESKYYSPYFTDWMIMYSGSKETGQCPLVVLDPKLGGWQYLLLPNAGTESMGSSGYSFSTMEYLVDAAGRRTGAGGIHRHHWRRCQYSGGLRSIVLECS